jgi:D-sedoheptulose 7-phosphate isomerase
MTAPIAAAFRRTSALLAAMAEDAALQDQIVQAATTCAGALRAGGTILWCGNGGSAADAQHLAAELVGRLARERPGLAAVALTADTAALTAIGNDYGFERVFARQVEALGRPGDVLVALSTSGRSANVIAALETARAKGLARIGLTGRGGGAMAALAEPCLRVPADDTQMIQEAHIVIGHVLCGLIENQMAGSTSAPG